MFCFIQVFKFFLDCSLRAVYKVDIILYDKKVLYSVLCLPMTVNGKGMAPEVFFLSTFLIN